MYYQKKEGDSNETLAERRTVTIRIQAGSNPEAYARVIRFRFGDTGEASDAVDRIGDALENLIGMTVKEGAV